MKWMSPERTRSCDHSYPSGAGRVLFSDSAIRRHKKFCDRYQLIGTTVGGRTLKIIFQLKPDNVVRIITGWPL